MGILYVDFCHWLILSHHQESPVMKIGSLVISGFVEMLLQLPEHVR